MDNELEQSYAKEQLGVQKGETKLLGLPWDKREDTITVTLPTEPAEPTKRNILGTLAKIYDPLGLSSPVTLAGKTLYREACDLKNSWDEPLPETLQAKWKCWERSLPQKVQIPRSVTAHQEDIKAIDLHASEDASQKGVSTAAYAVVFQESGVNQALITSKSRLSKKDLSIPRLEFVSGHMSANLLHNIRVALQSMPVRDVYCWLDSTVALHWIRGNGEYKQFVRNRVRKINKSNLSALNPTADNHANVGNRGGSADQLSDSSIKTSGHRTKCENYRPISILPIISKLFEKEVFGQLYQYLIDNSLLSRFQSGFRPKHSTLSLLIEMSDNWFEVTGLISVDIRKAFDSIDHKILLRKMQDQFGVQDFELKWFQSYLTKRVCAKFVSSKATHLWLRKLYAEFHRDLSLDPSCFYYI